MSEMIDTKNYKVNKYYLLKTVGFLLIITLTLFVFLIFPQFFELTLYASSFIILSVLIFILFIHHHRLTDATTSFLFFYALYYLIMPPLIALGTIWHYFGRNLVDNWNLAAKGNIGAILGLLGYSLGLLVSRRFSSEKRSQFKTSRELLTPKWARVLYKVYFLAGVAGWVSLFIIAGMPARVFLGMPADRRGIQPGGGAYLYTLLFCFNIAFLLYLLSRRRKTLISAPNILMMGVCTFALLIRGSRLFIAVLPLSFFFFYKLHLEQYGRISFSKSVLKKLCVVAFFLVLLLFSFYYSSYRAERRFELSWDAMVSKLISIADPSGYLVIIDTIPKFRDYWCGKGYLHPFIVYIPGAIFPQKYDYLYSAVRYTEIFYPGSNPFEASSSETVRGYTLLGEIYINFGWYGFIPVMFVIGFLNNRLSIIAHSPDTTVFFKLIYAFYLAVFSVGIVKMGFVGALEEFFQDVLVLFLFPILFLHKFSRSKT